MNPPAERFLTRSLQHHPNGDKIARVLAAAIAGADPAKLIKRSVSLTGAILQLQDQRLDLEKYQRVFLLGIGKAARTMTLACAELLGDRLTGGFVLAKPGNQPLPDPYRERLREFTGGHPVPDQTGMEASLAILEGLSGLQENDLVLALISGGGSALFTLPYPGVSLGDLIATNQLLLNSGADIQQINTIRKHLSSVKGGRLAQALYPAKIVTLILSDVPGDQLDRVASGPTVPDPTTFVEGLRIVRNFHLERKLPGAVLHHLEQGSQGKIPETPKAGQAAFNESITLLIGSNGDSLKAAAQQAKQEGFRTKLHPLPLQGNASSTGRDLARLLAGMAQSGEPLPRPACLIAGGETTVSLVNNTLTGKGGRNLELALAAVESLADVENCLLISLASDGEDGITDAAGAIVTGESLSRARSAGLDPGDYLRRHDSYHFFEALGDLLRPGPTGTNVNDLCMLFTCQRGIQ